ncbi:hypothetical protein BH11PSE7_BH11PSE7_35190 [soil metagenome]
MKVSATGAVHSRRSHGPKPATTTPALHPQENMASIKHVLKTMCNDALPYGPHACSVARHARDTVIAVVNSGATSALVDLPASVARRLARLGFTCDRSGEQPPSHQGPQEMMASVMPAAALAASRHVLRESPLQVPVQDDPKPGRTTKDWTVPELAAELACALMGAPPAATTASLKDLKGLGLSPRHLAEVLAARTPLGTPWLNVVLQEGHGAPVTAFMDALCELDLGSQLIAEIVTARSAGGIPGLFHARQDSEAVAAFIEGLQRLALDPDPRHRLNSQQLADVLAARISSGTPLLFFRLQDGNAQAVAAYLKNLGELCLEPHHNAGIVMARNFIGFPGLFSAMRNGHEEAVTAFMEGLLNLDLTPQQVADIVTASWTDSRNALGVAQHMRHAGAARAYLDGLARLQRHHLITDQQVADIVAAAAPVPALHVEDALPVPALHVADGPAALLAASRHVLREAPQRLHLPQSPLLPALRPAVSPSSIAFLSFCAVALFSGIVRELIDAGPEFEPTIDGPTPVTIYLPPVIVDERAPLTQPDAPALVRVLTQPQEDSSQQIADVLKGRGFDGKPGLLFALKNGHTAVVTAFMERLAGLGFKPGQILKVLAKSSDGYPGLVHAMRNGHSATVAAFMNGLKGLGLRPEQVAGILAVRDTNGMSGLSCALALGNAAAVSGFMTGLTGLGLDSEQVAETVAANDSDGVSGLFHALHDRHAAAVTAYMQGLKGLDLTAQQIARLVSPKDVNNLAGLFHALYRGYAPEVKALMEGLKGLGLAAGQIAEIVAPTSPDGHRALYYTMREGHAATVTAFVDGLHGLGLSPQQIVDIVQAGRTRGDTGLSIARKTGKLDSEKAFMACLARLQEQDLITPSQAAAIVAAAV